MNCGHVRESDVSFSSQSRLTIDQHGQSVDQWSVGPNVGIETRQLVSNSNKSSTDKGLAQEYI